MLQLETWATRLWTGFHNHVEGLLMVESTYILVCLNPSLIL